MWISGLKGLRSLSIVIDWNTSRPFIMITIYCWPWIAWYKVLFMNVQPVKKCYYNSLDTEHRTFRCTHYVNETKLFCFLFCFVFFSHREHLAFIYLFTMMTVEMYLVLEVLMIMLTPLDMVLPMYQHKRTFRVLLPRVYR